MYKYYTFALTAAAALFSKAIASDTCNPVEETDCDPDPGLTSSTYSVDFTAGADNDNWESTGGGNVSYTTNGAEFTISEKGDSPTLQTAWYIFFGRAEVHMKSAPGTGIVSCIVLLSDDYDEVDWEWLGGYPDEVQTNYFGQGDSGTSTTEDVDDAQDTSHNYTLYWTEEALSWYLDGSLLRTVTYEDANSGDVYPQTPSRVKIGIWAGGDSDNAEGTISWAGGETDYDEGPFTMIVESVDITNFNPANNYTYSDQTGDYTSIEFDVASDSDSDTGSSTTTAAKAYSSTATPAAGATQASEVNESPAATETPSTGSGSGDDSNDGSSNDGSDDDSSNDGSYDSGDDSSTGDNSSGSDDSSDNGSQDGSDSSSGDSSDCGCEDSSSGWQSGHHSGWGWSWGTQSGNSGHWHSSSHSGGKSSSKGTFQTSKFYHGGSKGHGMMKKRIAA